MRVAHYIHRYPPALGGAEAYFARLSEYLVARGDAVTVHTSTAFDLPAFWSWRGRTLAAGASQQRGVHVRRYPLWRWPGRRWLLKPLSLLPWWRWQCLTLPCNPICWRMWRDAGRSQERFDVVHATALPYAFPLLCALRLARRQGIPLMLTPFLHLGDPDDPRDATRRAYLAPPLLRLLREADAILVQTPTERQALLERGFAAERVHLQGLGVAPGECTGGDGARLRARCGITADEPLIGLLANQSVEKGSVDLLQACAQLWQRGQRLTVALAGPTMPSFERFWHGFGWRQHVRLLGPLDEAAKRDFFAGIDVFALPSRSDSFGLVLLEAWANGVPNVVYHAGGLADVVRHERDGLAVPCGDIAALAQALARLLDDASLRRTLGATGQERLKREFCWEEKLSLVRAVYQRLACS